MNLQERIEQYLNEGIFRIDFIENGEEKESEIKADNEEDAKNKLMKNHKKVMIKKVIKIF